MVQISLSRILCCESFHHPIICSLIHDSLIHCYMYTLIYKKYTSPIQITKTQLIIHLYTYTPKVVITKTDTINTPQRNNTPNQHIVVVAVVSLLLFCFCLCFCGFLFFLFLFWVYSTLAVLLSVYPCIMQNITWVVTIIHKKTRKKHTDTKRNNTTKRTIYLHEI